MEYNELIERVQHTSVDIPDTNAILGGMRRTIHRRRQKKTILASTACLIIAIIPLALSINRESPTPTLAEVVSATIQSSSDELPAPLTGYRNSIRNHQTTTLI